MIFPFLALVKKELISVLREKTILIAVLIQLFIASFSSALLLGMLSLYDSDTILKLGSTGITIGVVGVPENQMGNFLSDQGLTIVSYVALEDAEAAFYQGQVSALIDMPQNSNGITEVQMYLPDSDVVSSLIRMVVQEPLKQYEHFLRRQNGVEIRYTGLKGEPSSSFEFVYSVLIPMLMFFPAFVAGSMSIDSLTEEVENNTLQTLLSSPLSIRGVLGAKIATAVLFAVLQCTAWLVLLKMNKIEIQNPGWIILLATIVAGVTSTLAALGAILLKDRERSQFIYSLMLLAATSISILLNISPITAISRLAIGDYYTSGWNVAVFAFILIGLYLLMMKLSRRLMT